MSTVLHTRVSTADQTLARQRTQAEAADYRFDTVIADEGVSGHRSGPRQRTTKEAPKAGIAHAKAIESETKYRGRKPSFTREPFTSMREMLGQGTGVSEISKFTGLTRQTVYRIKEEPTEQAKALETWELQGSRKLETMPRHPPCAEPFRPAEDRFEAGAEGRNDGHYRHDPDVELVSSLVSYPTDGIL
ncbi:helix-turn-helix domain-containing protein [Ancylobacter sonchi]|uniref:helix-turn-helix domain-containing protein n=1 Tax=Ancylobacter sonchi TaxID=1937790 RepID=UPI001BD53161|nr:helix-turn-helix domain-containing protein [Ancylobacter sonchi]